MISPARRICFDLLSQIESSRVFSDDALNSKIMETVDERDRHLITEIVYGTLRRQSLLDYVLAGACSRSWAEVDQDARILLRLSLYQMWHMDRIPDHALVHDAVELAKRCSKRGVDRFINGILRNLTRNHPWENSDLIRNAPGCVRLSLPKWLWKRWSRRFGGKTAAEYAESLNSRPRTALRLGRPVTGNIPEGFQPSDLVPGAYIQNREGQEKNPGISSSSPIQDEASQLIPHLLGNIQGKTVWDTCAAPGGKTAVLCDLCGESGFVVASDRSEERTWRLMQILGRNLPRNPALLVADASVPAPFRKRFDAVFADVPCSGLGTLRRNPEIKWRFRPSDLSLLHKNQLGILSAVSEHVRKGGRLLYSTCSTEPEENEQVVENFLALHPDFRIEEPVGPAGIEKWTGGDACVRTFPGPRLWDGFFAALMVRKGDS